MARERLEQLHRAFSSPFSVGEAAKVLEMNLAQTRRLLAALTERGWLTRIRRNAYATLPLGATDPASWRADPWIIAATLFEPCYLGGWTACEYWELTEQIFRDVIVITSKRVRHSRTVVQETPFRVKVIPTARMFGQVNVWRNQRRVLVSDPTRTIIDILDDPALGGGIGHVCVILQTYFRGKLRNDALLFEYGTRNGNRAVFKRLGYLLDALRIDAIDLIERCRLNVSRGVSLLDPTVERRGPIVKQWALRVNVNVRAEAP